MVNHIPASLQVSSSGDDLPSKIQQRTALFAGCPVFFKQMVRWVWRSDFPYYLYCNDVLFHLFFGAFVNPDEWQHKINETMNTANPMWCQFDFVLFFCSPKNGIIGSSGFKQPPGRCHLCLSGDVEQRQWTVLVAMPGGRVAAVLSVFFFNQWVQPKKCTRTSMYLVDKIANVDTQL